MFLEKIDLWKKAKHFSPVRSDGSPTHNSQMQRWRIYSHSFLSLLEVGGNYFLEVIPVFLRNFHKTDAHSNGGIVVLYTIEI
jgi:hypothetical protein